MTDELDRFKPHYIHLAGAFKTKAAATAFAAYLANELGFNRFGVGTEKDGPMHRVYVPLLSAYWEPIDPNGWNNEMERLRQERKRCMASD